MGTITDLSHQKKNKDRVNVYIDGSFACGLDALTVVKNRLTVGTEIDEDELAAIQRESEGGRAFERAVKYASVRSRTKKELRTFLRDKGYAPATIADLVNKLTEYGFCDDTRFCREYVAAYKGKNGVNKIRAELTKLGAEAEAMEAALEEIDGQEEVAFAAAERYIRTHSKFDMRKLKAHLYARGFNGDDISAAAARVEEEYDFTDPDANFD